MGGSGLYTSAVAAGGETPPGGSVSNSETWDGTNWTETSEINTARNAGAQSGNSSTSAIYFAGEVPGTSPNLRALAEQWDGSSWTEVGDLNTATQRLAGAGPGNASTSALAFGGGPPNTAKTESWNGTSWTEVADLATAKHQLGGSGSSTSALAFGGETPPSSLVNTTEEFTASLSNKTITSS
jgi:hypothetical protein